MTRDAVERDLERVLRGVATSPSKQHRHRSVPWPAVAGLGNVLHQTIGRWKGPRASGGASATTSLRYEAAVEAMLQEPEQGASDQT